MAVKSRITLEQFLRREDTKPYREYVCGQVFRKPMPNRQHATIQSYLIEIIAPFLRRAGLGRILAELRCIFGPPGRERAYVPDLVYLARGRLPTDQYLRVAPDLVIEILSPRQHMMRFLGKIHFYLLHGVRLVWVIGPARGTVTVFAPGEEERVLTAGDALDGGDVLPGFSVPVADLFAEVHVPSR